ncbi:hypothetical protein [Sphingomonas sp. RIT328]|uniref:hypothetical protein n=1 Tax=Sphingomonas sp. RIT328 TaxID=1470591 RepID=UPI0004480B68|nr:hypothetical protein [Sphingomonas sp. RIT328]EZP52681.1 hypothetical protein BW41_02444 [Sphingomonas sp. RIT328]
MLRKGGGAVQIASPKGVQIELSLVDDRVRVKKIVMNSSVKVLYVDGRYEVFLTPPHNDYPDTIKAALPGRPISCLFEAPGFNRPDVTMGSVKTLQSETLLIELLCPREPD